LLEKAYLVFKNLLGEQHPNTKTVKGNLDSVLMEKLIAELSEKFPDLKDLENLIQK